MRNPFIYQVPVAPAGFVGRERVLSLIFGQLQSPNRANVAVHGPLGIGKTSLLNYISDTGIAAGRGLDPETFLVCRIDCQSLGDFTPDRFWRRLLRSMARKVDEALQASIDALVAQDEIVFEDIQDILDDLEYADRVLIALLDEFECTIRTDTDVAERMTRHFLGMLSSLGRRIPRVFAMVIATQQPLPVLGGNLDTWRGSPFPTVFITQELAPFSMDEAETLVDRALDGTSVTFSSDERSLLYEQTGGYPALFQAAAAALFQAKQTGAASTDMRDVVLSAVVAGQVNGATHASSPEGIRLDEASGDVWVDGRPVRELSNKEFALLRFLSDNAGRVCMKNDIWEAVWPEYREGGIEDYPIQKLVSRLRQKIEPDPSRPRYILTVWGRGYKFVK